MEIISKLKWSLFIFPVIYSVSFGCEKTLNNCYYDFVCAYDDNSFEDVDIRNFDEYCDSVTIYSNGYNNYPMRIKLKSVYDVETLLGHLNNVDTRMRRCIVLLEVTGSSLSNTLDLSEMDNLKTLYLSNNLLTYAKLSNEANLNVLENIDLSHNRINSIEVDDNQHVYRELRMLNLSYNLLTDISGGVFEPFKRLENLDLSHNNIVSLDHYSFEGLKNTKYLSLSYNNISDINVSLFRFSSLEDLYLDNNNIEKLSLRNFETLRNLRTVSLEFNSISSIDKDTFSNTESLTTLRLQHNLLRHIYKDAFLSTNSLTSIDLSNNLIQSLPKDLFKNKTITSFSIIGNNLEGPISEGTFEGLQLLTELDVSHQAITEIGDFAFRGLDKLTKLLLNNNEIKSISEHSFHTLISLKQLDLSNNLIVSIEFSKQDLRSLEIVYLGNNFIKQILYGDFQGLHRLRFLDISNNNISKLETSCFKVADTIESIQLFNNPINGSLSNNSFIGLHLVPVLDLSRTSITAIDNGTFSGMVQLQELNISRSSVYKVQYGAFVNTGGIKSIDLSFNKLTEFVVNGKDLPNLTTLYLNHNAIIQISNYVFKHMTILNKIIMSHNLIQSIADEAFTDQTDLRYLDVSFNTNLTFRTLVINDTRSLETLLLSGIKNITNFERIGTLRKLALSHAGARNVSILRLNTMRHLTSLVISNNNIAKIDITALKNVSALESLDLSFNNISFIQPGTFKDNVFLFSLNLSHNALIALNYGALRGLIRLSTLDMSYNSIHYLGREIFYDTPNLKVLIADYNRITDVSNEFLSIYFDSLSIGHNPLPCEKVIELIRSSGPHVNAINKDEHSNDNIDGIVCNMNNHMKIPELGFHDTKINTTMQERILLDIKDILQNSSEKRELKIIPDGNSSHLLKDLVNKLDKIGTEQTEKLKHIKTDVTDELNRTNSLLERILKGILGFGSFKTRLVEDSIDNNEISRKNISYVQNSTLIGNDSKIDTLVSHVNQIKQELLYMENVISEIDRKISLERPLYTPSILEKLNKSEHEEVMNANTGRSFIFVEVCVSLILLMLLCFFMYKFYESKIFKQTRSLSSRHITDGMDNSNL